MSSAAHPIDFEPFDCSPSCHGYIWTVSDEDLLATYVADLLLGECRHVEQVLLACDSTRVGVIQEEINAAVARMEDVSNEQRRYHRDGWLFQLISWIALRCTDPSTLAAVPHSQPADKGFDNLIIRLDAQNRPFCIVVGEDKATDNARNMVTQKVWPEVEAIEGKRRDSELKSELAALLPSGGYSADEISALIKRVLWEEEREFRVAIASPDSSPSSLFAGFDDQAPGVVGRRRGEMLELEPLRDWFDTFAALVVKKLEAMQVTHV
jgi:hypothetical protein